MNRRLTVEFPWISMMDLLFGLFGALILLTTLITLKLGVDNGVEDRPFFLVTMTASSDNAAVQTALGQMHMAIEHPAVNGRGRCLQSAPVDADCTAHFTAASVVTAGTNAVRFMTAAASNEAPLSLMLFAVPSGAASDLQFRPMLRDLAALRDLPPSLDSETIDIEISIKNGLAFAEYSVTKRVETLITPGSGTASILTGDFAPLAVSNMCQSEPGDCHLIEVNSDGFIRLR